MYGPGGGGSSCRLWGPRRGLRGVPRGATAVGMAEEPAWSGSLRGGPMSSWALGSLAPGCGPMGVLGMLAARCNRLLTKSEKRIQAATCCRDFKAHWETQFLLVVAEVSILFHVSFAMYAVFSC